MNDPNHKPKKQQSASKTSHPAVASKEERARRMAVLRKYGGIWANRTDIPLDGLEFERRLREPWKK